MSLFERRSEGSSEEAPPAPKGPDKRDEIRDDEKEKEEKARRAALAHLVNTGRARNPEEAERYFETLNRLKERLVVFFRTKLANEIEKERTRGKLNAIRPDVRTGHSTRTWHRREESEDPAVLSQLMLKDIDRQDPHLWALERMVASDAEGYAWTEGLSIRMRAESPLGGVLLLPDSAGELGLLLKEYLSPEELEFLWNEYKFALQDVARRLREVAEEATRQDEFSSLGWHFLR